jgi:FkbM family methyltransferase
MAGRRKVSETAQDRVIELGDVNCLVRGRHGNFLANRYDTFVGLALVRYGEYGEFEWDVLSQLIKPGTTVVEVGANIGSHTVSLAKAVGPKGRVIAIEPQRIIHQYLAANIALNALSNVECHWAACGKEPGRLGVPQVDYFASEFQNFGGLSLSEQEAGEHVPVVRLDDIMGHRSVQMIKIDVEGMEAQVLRGAAQLIATSRPVIYAENDRPKKSDELLSLLWSMNYRTFWHTPSLYNPNNFFGDEENIYSTIASFNVLCFPKEATLNVGDFAEITTLGSHPLTWTTADETDKIDP